MKAQHLPTIKTFGAMLRFLRQRAHMTQRDLATQVGYSEAHINRFENGIRMPSPDVVTARFVSALELAHDSEEAIRLVHLAAKPEKTVNRATTQLGSASSDDVPVPYTLPIVASRLFGRDEDIEHALTLFDQPETRLLTLIGPPGVGKTRLSIALAARLMDHFADGAIFVPLATIDDSDRVPDAILQAMGIASAAEQPLAQLMRVLHERRLLLVLDNYEQLLNGTSAESAATTMSKMIAAAKHAKFIVTSRAPLRTGAEHIYEVPPLTPAAAFELFLSRARASNPGFQVRPHDGVMIGDICARLDHLPLAIELAAARTRIFEVPSLLKRLADPLAVLTIGPQDLPQRQRTLRNAIDWSYQLLSSEEQTLFRRISAFADGCTLPMLEAIAAAGLVTPVADLVQSLVEKSLLRSTLINGAMRFYFLEMLRSYAAEALAATSEATEIFRRHDQWFVDYVEDVQSDPAKSDNRPWYDWFDAEWLNLRAVIQRSIDSDDPVPGLRLAASLGWTWQLHGVLNDALHLVTSLLAHPHAATYRHLCARVKMAGSRPAKGLGHAEQSVRFLQDALAVFRETGDKWNASWALSCLADHACNHADYDLATTLLAESVPLSREVGDRKGLAWALMWVGWVDRIRGNFTQALVVYAELSKLARDMNSGTMSHAAFAWTAWVYEDMGDYERAGTLLEQAYQACMAVGLKSSALNMQSALGCNALYRGDLDTAILHLSAAAEGLHQRAQQDLRMSALLRRGFAVHLHGDIAEGKANMQEALQYAQANGHAAIMSDSLNFFAWAAVDEHDFVRAVRLMGAAASYEARSSTRVPAYAIRFQSPRVAHAKASLNHQDFHCYWDEGRQMSLDAAVAFALDSD